MNFQPCPNQPAMPSTDSPDELRAKKSALLASEPFLSVANERIVQDDRWGDQSDLHPAHLMSILTEEVGEAAREVNELLRGYDQASRLSSLYVELMQVAAVATQMMEIVQQDLAQCQLEEQAANRALAERPLKPLSIIVNGTTHEWAITAITYDEIAKLASVPANLNPSITYRLGDTGGILGMGQSVVGPLLDGMDFTVCVTGNA